LIVPSPNVGGGSSNTLVGVSCAGINQCTAVGYTGLGGTTNQTLVESWSGGTWSITPSPNVSGASGSVLIGVSCPALASCTTVGYADIPFGTQTLVENLNGSTWSIVPSPNRSGTDSSLSSVSCLSSSSCTAVGAGPSGKTLVEGWNGITWSIVPSPNVGGKTQSYLYEVSCLASADCTAVGSSFSVSAYRTLVESWNGAVWSIVPSPSVPTAVSNQLLSVSCPDTGDCTAVGLSFTGSSGQTLIEHGLPPLAITTAFLPPGMVGQPYSGTLHATGGRPPYRFWYQGTLPRGLHFNSTTGVLSGSPLKAGSYSVTFRVHDTKVPGLRIDSTSAVLSINIS
jgi:hypothetical protein